ncbi:hypothetical protein GWO43_00560 [candidate division KSB1 bacterium]|nr:hypothetical protein [candidate division KSB1 bacterium]NIR68889.1 hypothetical protein [candidate division KSB1 bacterium]NIS22570.1 hypothetical protein [candidate division KSB1 bacterium]NIT69415.1 hypothetical protein [candidate division KSB1 bacterium]NIU23070.1 hypothetical protein [candidate division KSB1 bacterium]
MIGVISRENEAHIVKEFFQLFKTPWEYYLPQKSYDIVLSTKDVHQMEAKVLLIYNSRMCMVDSIHGIVTQPQDKKELLKYKNHEYPIYGNQLTFISSHPPLIQTKGGSGIAGLKINANKKQVLRIGYDLFEEISFLLTEGQPKENAIIPTLEIHILMLRDWILQAEIPLVEIPPIPAGHKFFVCLTHDVDFAGIRRHKFDPTMWGFIYRALVGSFFAALKGRLSWSKVIKKWMAVLSLPGVYLGLARDFWFQFDRYLKIDKNFGSTFFIIPFKNSPGDEKAVKASRRRAVRYDITDISKLAKAILDEGYEIGLHGIDAWHDSAKGRQEMNRICEVVDCSEIGVRMHWLYFDEHSPQALEKAGFIYDSSFGHNDAVGHRAGTTQAFQPMGAQILLELPLHIMDTALFYGKRMNLSDSQAAALCDRLIEDAVRFGGSLTINWHHRSLAPERLWGEFYSNLLRELEARGAYFMAAMRVVKWFQKRREILFEEVCFTKSGLKARFKRADFDCDPPLLLRVYLPSERVSTNDDFLSSAQNSFEVILSNARDMQITFEDVLNREPSEKDSDRSVSAKE